MPVERMAARHIRPYAIGPGRWRAGPSVQAGRMALFGSAPTARLMLGARSLSLRTGGSAPPPGLATVGDEVRAIGGAASLADTADALRGVLAAYPRLAIDVRLGCSWSRLMLVPWMAHLTREERWNNVARARFEEVFGDAAQGWDIRVARDLPGRDRLAAAWPGLLHAELATARQVRSARVDLLEHLSLLLAAEPGFSGAVAEIDEDSAGFILLVGGGVRRVRWSRFDDADGLVTALRAEWAGVLAHGAEVPQGSAALALTPPAPTPGSPRARVAAAIAAGLGFKRAFCLG